MHNGCCIQSNLRRILFDRDVNISKVARKTGISRTTLTALYRCSGTGISYAVLEKLCDYLGCDVGDLLVVRKKREGGACTEKNGSCTALRNAQTSNPTSISTSTTTSQRAF